MTKVFRKLRLLGAKVDVGGLGVYLAEVEM